MDEKKLYNHITVSTSFIIFILLFIMFSRILTSKVNDDRYNSIIQKLDSVQVQLDSIKAEQIMTNEFLYD